jgi:hypothetical protein
VVDTPAVAVTGVVPVIATVVVRDTVGVTGGVSATGTASVGATQGVAGPAATGGAWVGSGPAAPPITMEQPVPNKDAAKSKTTSKDDSCRLPETRCT